MAKPDLSVYGGRLLHHGYAGMMADMQEKDLDSLVNESVFSIDFGVAVAYGAYEMGCKPVSSGTDKIIGISSRYAIGPADGTGDVAYRRYESVPVCRRGNLYVIAAENTAIGDPVIAIVAQGGALGSTTRRRRWRRSPCGPGGVLANRDHSWQHRQNSHCCRLLGGSAAYPHHRPAVHCWTGPKCVASIGRCYDGHPRYC